MRMRSASTHHANSSSSPVATVTEAAVTRKSNLLIVTRVPKFLRCLYDILHHEDPSILAWSSDGSFFQIFSTTRLEDAVLPKYFKHSKFASFQRQLNNFGFRKWTKTQSSVCTFSHHLFVQRHPSELVELIIEQNESSSQQQLEQEQQDEEDAALARARATAAAATTASPKKSVTKKRKRAASDAMDSSDLLPYKQLHHMSAMMIGPNGKELSFQEQLNFQVESWDLVPIAINPVEENETRQHNHHQPVHSVMKNELGNETPTSAAALNELTFNFTMEELDDILFTTSDPECIATSCGFSADERLFDNRFAMSKCVNTSVGFATAAPVPSFSALAAEHLDTGMYLNEMFAKPENEFWLPC
jgi:hypothetical protein